jgi:hypothetical protein
MRHLRVTLANRKTLLGLFGFVTWYVTASVASLFDPGPDWFDTRRYPHADAAVLGTFVALAVVAAFGLLLAVRDHPRR